MRVQSSQQLHIKKLKEVKCLSITAFNEETDEIYKGRFAQSIWKVVTSCPKNAQVLWPKPSILGTTGKLSLIPLLESSEALLSVKKVEGSDAILSLRVPGATRCCRPSAVYRSS